MLKRRAYEVASFGRHLPRYFREHVHLVSKMYGPPASERAMYFARDNFVVVPDRAVTALTWAHVLSSSEGAREVSMFLRASEGRRCFLDVGAAEGFFSAIFLRSSSDARRLVAVEPIAVLYEALKTTLQENARANGPAVNASARRALVLEKSERLTLGDEKFGGLFNVEISIDHSEPVESLTLEELCSEEDIVPDLIKIDIESYEWELLQSARDMLIRTKPRIHLELHNQMLRQRGFDGNELVSLLLNGWEIVDAVPARYRKAPVARLSFWPRER